MTVPDIPDVPSMEELILEQRRAREREQYDTLILATAGVLPSTTMTVTYRIPPTKVPQVFNGELVVIDSIRVEAGRSAISEHPDDSDGWLRVYGHGRRTNKNAEVNERARYEDFWLAEEVAAPLILAALTRTPIVPKDAMPKKAS